MTNLTKQVHFTLVVLAGTMTMVSTAIAEQTDNDSRAKRFIARHEATVRPLEIESARCWWDANITGSDAAFRKKEQIETRLDLLLADHETFAELKAIKEQPLRDPLLARQIAVLYLQYLGRQIDPELIKEMSARSNAVEKAYSVFRAKVGKKALTENEVHEVLRTFEGFRPAAGGLGSEQGRGADPRAGRRQAGPSAESRSPATRLQRLLRDAACLVRIDPRASAQAVRRA